MSLTDRENLFCGHAPLSQPALYGATAAETALVAQRAAFAEQDEALKRLSEGAFGIRGVAEAVALEVGEQNELLDGLADGIARADKRTTTTAARTAGSEKSPYSIANFCLLLWPLVLLILLIIITLRRFIFG
jgi:hypothetical protein